MLKLAVEVESLLLLMDLSWQCTQQSSLVAILAAHSFASKSRSSIFSALDIPGGPVKLITARGNTRTAEKLA
jgi:hypothetical protein